MADTELLYATDAYLRSFDATVPPPVAEGLGANGAAGLARLAAEVVAEVGAAYETFQLPRNGLSM